MLKISRFTIEYKDTYLGLDEKKPRFSWILQSDGQNIKQRSYRLKVVGENNAAVWDSGEVASDTSVFVGYAGEKLLPRSEYQVYLTVTDDRYERAIATLTFETGLMGKRLSGNFISRPFGDAVPEFSKEFSLSKKVKRARAYATALGVYELFLNGKRVGDMYDAPGWTSYAHRLQYQTYDVTELLSSGGNKIAALVGKGWYAGVLGYFHRKNCYGEKCALCLDLYIEFEDGTETVIKTDESWRAKESALRFSEFQDGEIYDCTFAAEESFPVETVEYDKKKIVGQICEPVRVTEVLPAKKLLITPKGERVLDFGQNATGIVEFQAKGERGQKVKISHAEVLDEEGNFYTANLRGAKAEDIYILDGTEQTLRPHFTTHGFRYIKVEGFGEIKPENFRLLVLHTDMERTGEFHCEDPLVERLQKNIVWGQRGNFLDIPTDCPQRDERLGWTGDAQVFCRTAAFNYNVAPFFAKWLGDLAAEQTLENGVPQTVPNIVPVNDMGAAAWGDAATICPWTIYEVYGDKRILERQYASMKEWVEFIRSRAKNDLWLSGFQYGDWLALDKEEFSDRTGATDKYFIASMYYAYSAKLVAEAAKVLGKKADAAEYTALHDRIISSFQKEFVTERGRLVSETQTAMVLALGFGLVPERFREDIKARLRANIKDHGDHLVTGFVGTPYLMHVLSENGMHDIAETLLTNTDFPSWLYEVKMGATTVWERWNAIQPDGTLFDPGMSSFNHYAYGSVGDWLYRKVAGIDCLEAGYKKISVKPYPVRALGDFGAKLQTVHGEIGVECRYAEDKAHWSIAIPENTEAVIELPDGRKFEVGSGRYTYETADDPEWKKKKALSHKFKEAVADAECYTLLQREISLEELQPMCAFGGERSLKDVAAAKPQLGGIMEQIGSILEKRNV